MPRLSFPRAVACACRLRQSCFVSESKLRILSSPVAGVFACYRTRFPPPSPFSSNGSWRASGVSSPRAHQMSVRLAKVLRCPLRAPEGQFPPSARVVLAYHRLSSRSVHAKRRFAGEAFGEAICSRLPLVFACPGRKIRSLVYLFIYFFQNRVVNRCGRPSEGTLWE